MFEVKEIKAKSILTATRLKDADFDFSVNPYIGCRFGCVYCYASFMGRFVGKKTGDWGEYVFPKVNAPELLAKEIRKLKNKGKGKSIWFSSVTDPYQGLEAKYQLTRKCLQVLEEYGFEGTISFLTKSNLIIRDIDVFKKLKKVDLGLTITATDDAISRYFEKFAPPASERLAALKTLHNQGFRTYAFIGPLLPHILSDENKLNDLFAKIAETGTKEIYVEFLNTGPYIVRRLKNELKDIDPEIFTLYLQSRNKSFRQKWNKQVANLVKKYNLRNRFGNTIYHPEMN